MEQPPWLTAPPVGEYPYVETHDLRTGPDLNKGLLALLPYVGVWRGRGQGGYPTLDGPDFLFAQEIRFSHDGRPFLAYESRAWLIEEDGTPIRPAFREVGWWRPVLDADGRATDDVEALMCAPTGIQELYLGNVKGLVVEMATDAIVRTGTAKEVTGGHRLYGIVEKALLYTFDLAAEGQPLQSHLSAKLERVAG